MFTQKDLHQISNQQISIKEIEQQIQHFVEGFPYLNLLKAATVGNGIIQVSDAAAVELANDFDTQIQNLSLLKFVPASGAATRMFKSLFTFKDSGKEDKSVIEFNENLSKFAFYDDLKTILKKDDLDIEVIDKQTIIDYLLIEKGLDYGNLPKGLLKFHRYGAVARTPIEEHLVEGAKYANSGSEVCLHFTVSPEHRSRFEQLTQQLIPKYETQFGVKYMVSFSEQKPSTDTLSVNLDNSPFRNTDGTLLFRPAGHGALLSNLNDQDGDVVFLKNIDNVGSESLSSTTYLYKKVIAALMLKIRQQIFNFMERIKNGENSAELVAKLTNFYQETLCTMPPPGFDGSSDGEKITYFRQKLDRPIRVCGMVKNVGEPGGGPFFAKNVDGSISLQVVESAQVDMADESQKALFEKATHFNPVDVVCSLRGFGGKKFDLMSYRDLSTGFISQKSKDGNDLKAQELPGLWNGSMADWNTIFVEVPLVTFSPVKTVNDLLRREHQG